MEKWKEDSDGSNWHAESGDEVLVDGDIIFSDESSFHGSDMLKADFESRVMAYDPNSYWDVRQWDVQCIAARAADQSPQAIHQDRNLAVSGRTPSAKNVPIAVDLHIQSKTKSQRPFNPYEGHESAKQLSESLDEFISRLRPSQAKLETTGPWILIADPFADFRPTDPDIASFKQEGSNALSDYQSRKLELESRYPDKGQGSITRMLKPDRESLEIRIMDLAKKYKVTCGKWMLFVHNSRVDDIWIKTARAVMEGRLGCSAKVATDDGDPNNNCRLICIYTHDFTDIHEVKHVLVEMIGLGLVAECLNKSENVYYKCDAYTHLDIMSGNEYKLRASMYSGRDMLSGHNHGREG